MLKLILANRVCPFLIPGKEYVRTDKCPKYMLATNESPMQIPQRSASKGHPIGSHAYWLPCADSWIASTVPMLPAAQRKLAFATLMLIERCGVDLCC